MEIKDLLFVTEENTKVEIYDVNSLLWDGVVDMVDFLNDVPYGDYEVCSVGVSGGILQIHI